MADGAARPGQPRRGDGAQTGRQGRAPRVRATHERKRAPRRGGKTGGKNFQPGSNTHTGEPFVRGVDLIPRGTVSSMYTALLHDDGTLARTLEREARQRDQPARAFRVRLMRSLLKAADTPRLARYVAEQIGDRLEGRPVQKVETSKRRTVVFYDASKAAPRELIGQGAMLERSSDAPTLPPVSSPPEPAARVPAELAMLARAGAEDELPPEGPGA